MSCQEIRPYLEAFVDQELSPERTLDVEQHVAACASCRAEVDMSRTLSAVTRSAVAEVSCCPNFQARLGRSLAEERRRQEGTPILASKPLPWRTISPIAAAAAIALMFGAAQRRERSVETEPLLASTENQLMDVLLQHHSAPPAPSLTALDLVKRMEPRLGFPVNPPNLDRYGARFVGANLVNVDETPAASLHYDLNNGRRLTFYVYDPEKLPLRAAVRTLHPRVVQNQAVFVGHRRGYSIATCERHGVGYAVTTELGDTESAELVAAVDR